MADILVDTFGAGAVIGRFGGDEFCVIIDGISKKDLAERIYKVHSSLSKVKKRNSWPSGVDVSCGFQKYDANTAMTAKQFQKTIDNLMYLEKQKHHNYY